MDYTILKIIADLAVLFEIFQAARFMYGTEVNITFVVFYLFTLTP